MKKFYILLIALFIVNGASAQWGSSCLPEGITFSTQAQIDSFQADYPACIGIEGGVIIEGWNSIINLNGLSTLTSIGGYLSIKNNDALTNLTGIEGLMSIGGSLEIYYNDALTSLTGLDNLTSIGGYLEINENYYSLTSLTGLENLTSIGSYFNISNNYALTSLTGLENLSSIGGALYIGGNSSLATCDSDWLCDYMANPDGIISIWSNASGCNSVIDVAYACGGEPCLPYGEYNFLSQTDIDHFQTAFPNCTELQGRLIIGTPAFGNDITNLSGLDNVTSIGGNLEVWNSDALNSLSGLDNLTSIGGYLLIMLNDSITNLTELENLDSIGGSLSIGENIALTSLTGLNNVTTIGEGVSISDNPALTSLTGLDNFEANTISELYIRYNSSLSNCAVQSICDYLASPNGTVYIDNNATGCNSQEEVDSACVYLSTDEINIHHAFSIYPNPASITITISLPITPQKNATLTIYNINGQQLIQRQITEAQTVVDVSGLSQGVYLVKITDARTVQVGKIIRQ